MMNKPANSHGSNLVDPGVLSTVQALQLRRLAAIKDKLNGVPSRIILNFVTFKEVMKFVLVNDE